MVFKFNTTKMKIFMFIKPILGVDEDTNDHDIF